MAPECQSFLDNVVARDWRHLIAELPRLESLARDRFDSDCVLGTQFEPRILSLTEISWLLETSPELAGLFSGILSLQRASLNIRSGFAARSRHHDASRQGNVSDVGRFRRIRALDHSGAGAGRPSAGQGRGQTARTAANSARTGSAKGAWAHRGRAQDREALWRRSGHSAADQRPFRQRRPRRGRLKR
jgi:hypothetical protein